MPFWHEIDLDRITIHTTGSRTRLSYESGPLRFQIPRGYTRYGVGQYKSVTISNLEPKFLDWWRKLEAKIMPLQPNKPCLGEYGLRVKVDDTTLIFNSESKFIADEHVEGFLRDLDLSCILDIEGTYLYKGVWGASARAHQIKFYAPVPKIPSLAVCEDSETAAEPVLKGCAFLE
jgi:hypothetical protein